MTPDELKDAVAGKLGDKMSLLDTGRMVPMFEISAANLLTVAESLRDDAALKFDYFCNLGAVDKTERFEAVYSVASIVHKHRLDFKVILDHDHPEIDSVQEIWPAANWYEREMWELFGINIRNHHNLTRFLLPDDWDQGNPMRRDWDAPDFEKLPEL
ncbi:MAG: NADH-quinone oxidoreductase subunit C [Candidatus Zixiibacteriota bacterium]|nr:MAG: NADH-quinone oxidoreductase subunit C [candidate division Zixibacteria bacterium]